MQSGETTAGYMGKIMADHTSVIYAKIVMLMCDAITTPKNHFDLLQTRNWEQWENMHTASLIQYGNNDWWQEAKHTNFWQIILEKQRSIFEKPMRQSAKQLLSF